MDNPATESTGPLDLNQAAAVFGDILEPKGDNHIDLAKSDIKSALPKLEPEQTAAEESADPVESEAEATPETESESEPEKFTVKVDGKEIEVSLDELKNGYQRQADYTRKTMEAAETRRSADAELSRAQQERAQYAQKLGEQSNLLAALINEQSNTNWQQLIDTDPVEYLKQRNLLEQRQAVLSQYQMEQQRLFQLHQAEQAEAQKAFLTKQQDELLAKLPDWKDEAKATAEKGAIKDYLKKEFGFTDADLSSVADHRSVLLARKAMLFDQMVSKAQAAEKRVEKLPTKVERPGTAETQTIDKRGSAFQRLSKSGRVEDAAAVFASIL